MFASDGRHINLVQRKGSSRYIIAGTMYQIIKALLFCCRDIDRFLVVVNRNGVIIANFASSSRGTLAKNGYFYAKNHNQGQLIKGEFLFLRTYNAFFPLNLNQFLRIPDRAVENQR
jgi:hypothetical protein